MVPLSDYSAMDQLGKVLLWLITTVTYENPAHDHIVFAKWGIKDGVWQLVVAEGDTWHFCYMLPHLHPDNPIEIVKPTCLQIDGLSHPLFCTTSETAQDVPQKMLSSHMAFHPHPLKSLCLPHPLDTLLWQTPLPTTPHN